MEDNTKQVLSIIIAVLIAWGGIGVVNYVSDPVTTLPTDFNIEDYIDIEDLRGEDGARGIAGRNGRDGTNGVDGSNGIDGDSFSFSLGELVDDVVDEMENREDRVIFAFSGEEGNYTYEFEIDGEDSYRFEIRHFGSGDFDVSIENEDGDINFLVDTSGHISHKDTRILADGSHIVRVSADGDWSIEVTQK